MTAQRLTCLLPAAVSQTQLLVQRLCSMHKRLMKWAHRQTLAHHSCTAKEPTCDCT